MERVSKALTDIPKLSIYQRIVFSVFEKFKKGTLHLTLPDGNTYLIGESNEVTCSIHIKNNNFFKRCVLYGDIGFGEAYVDGDWDTDDVTSVIKWVILNVESSGVLSGTKTKSILANLLKPINRMIHKFNSNTKTGSQKNISYHYDLSNDFYKLWLDKSMTYSCGIFETKDSSLYESQQLKYQKLCEDLALKETDHVLEIGCGWGGFAEYAATNYGCRITGVTISKEQLKFAKERIKNAGLEDKVDLRFQDYRDIDGKFDKIVSIEMLEAVGAEFYPKFFEKCSSLLKPEGLLSIQVITSPDSRFESFRKGVDWIQKYIFPGSLLPSTTALNEAALKTSDFQLYHLRDIGPHYARTLKEWRVRFFNRHEEIKKLGFDEKFSRMWNYYLCYCEAAFISRNISDIQITYIRPNNTSVHKFEY
jgi:cyclopropane-fatty-acyl-phospholipid synthase